jgi:tripartite-type tricarboxylate transporter receptor subunit TctC
LVNLEGTLMRSILIRSGLLSVAFVGLFASEPSWPQAYPFKPIRLIASGSAAGGADVVVRPIAQKLSESFGQQVVVDNRTGGGGVIAAQAVLSSSPDGYTMFFGNAISMSIAPALNQKLPYDPVRDFAPVTLVATAPLMVAVHPSLPVKSVKELVAFAKARPGQVLCASNGTGSIQHLTIAMFNRAAGISLLHVPYKGGTPAVIDTVGGQAQMIITAVPTLLSQVRASRLRALAVTSSKRVSGLPEIPTMAESGLPGVESVQWFGIFARRNTPVAIIEKWSGEVRKAMESPSVKSGLTQEGAEPAAEGPQALAEFHRVDMAKWQKVVRESNIVME